MYICVHVISSAKGMIGVAIWLPLAGCHSLIILALNMCLMHHYEEEPCQLSVHVISVLMAHPSNVPSLCYIIKFVLLSYLFLFLWHIIWEEGDGEV
jgi:hypothetical protein